MSLLSGTHLSVQFSTSCLARSVFMLMDNFPNETPFRMGSFCWVSESPLGFGVLLFGSQSSSRRTFFLMSLLLEKGLLVRLMFFSSSCCLPVERGPILNK